MKTIRGHIISSESIAIDNTTFVDCTLIDCIFEYSGYPVRFERTRMRGCRYVFFGLAKGTVKFLQETGLMCYDPAQ